MAEIDEAFRLTESGNSEVLAAWLEQSVKHEYMPAYNRLEEFLINTGRRKFLMPLYRALIQTEEGKDRAKQIYTKARPNYHFVSYDSVDELLAD